MLDHPESARDRSDEAAATACIAGLLEGFEVAAEPAAPAPEDTVAFWCD